MADIVILVANSICALLVAFLGLYVGLPRILEGKHYRILGAFALLTITVICLTGLQGYRSGRQQGDLTQRLSKLQTDLSDSKLELQRSSSDLQASSYSLEYIKGQISGLNIAVTSQGPSTANTTSAFIAALKRLNAAIPPPAISMQRSITLSPSQQNLPFVSTQQPIPQVQLSAAGLVDSLKSMSSYLSSIRNGWQSAIRQVDQNYNDEYRMAVFGGRTPPTRNLNIDTIQMLEDRNKDAIRQYQVLSPRIGRLHDDAILYMKLTPNQTDEDKRLFQKADSQAQTPISLRQFQENQYRQDQFAEMVQYLDTLIRKMGDFH